MKWGILDCRPTHPSHNYKRGVSQTFDPPTQAGTPPDPPPLPYSFLKTMSGLFSNAGAGSALHDGRRAQQWPAAP